jgi:RimJ/RimL family protein N-acetyltransferase
MSFAKVRAMEHALTPYRAASPLVVETGRLRIEPLDADRDWWNLSRIGGNPAVARNLMSVHSPWTEAQVRDWIARSLWRGRPPFRLGIWAKGGPLIGALGLGGTPLGISYFLDQGHWGHGYATEAMTAFLAAVDRRFAPDALEADHFADNPQSGRILHKLGFMRVGEGLGTSAARLMPAPVIHYRRGRPA